MAAFAWKVRGGDTLFVADTDARIVGRGFVKGGADRPAYRFDVNSPIVTAKGVRWKHTIPVDWDNGFEPIVHRPVREPQVTLIELTDEEIQSFEIAAQRANHATAELPEDRVRVALQLSEAYPRYTPAALRMIERKHAELSNSFTSWLAKTHGLIAETEHSQIDSQFTAEGKTFMVEFKIAYQGHTKRAVREALGQIFEYNHYPPRMAHSAWLLVLDIPPTPSDLKFLEQLRKNFGVPLNIGWQAGDGFQFHPNKDPIASQPHG